MTVTTKRVLHPHQPLRNLRTPCNRLLCCHLRSLQHLLYNERALLPWVRPCHSARSSLHRSRTAATAVHLPRQLLMGPARPQPQAPTAWTCPCCLRGCVIGASTGVWGVDRSSPGLLPLPSCDARPATAAARPVSAAVAAGGGTAPHSCALSSPAALWEVVLLVDNREVRSRSDRGYLAAELQGKGVTVEVRALALGDFMWIVRRREGMPRPAPPKKPVALPSGDGDGESEEGGAAAAAPPPKKRKRPAAAGAAPSAAVSAAAATASASAAGKPPPKKRAAAKKPPPPSPWVPTAPPSGEREWVLDVIVERKGVGDLAASLIDGRYSEQKMRLAESGLRVVYLIEGDPSKLVDNAGYGQRIGSKHIHGAMVSTQVGNGFHVVATHTLDATIAWLAKLHTAMVALFRQGARCETTRGVGVAQRGKGAQGAEAPTAAAATSASSLSHDHYGRHGVGEDRMSALAFSQAGTEVAAMVADPFCLIGGGSGRAGRGGGGSDTCDHQCVQAGRKMYILMGRGYSFFL